MSVRAYRINKINYENEETFNLWHDEELTDFFEKEGLFETLNEGSGITELSVETLKNALKEIKDLPNDIIKSLKKDIVWAKKNNEDYIQYYCF